MMIFLSLFLLVYCDNFVSVVSSRNSFFHYGCISISLQRVLLYSPHLFKMKLLSENCHKHHLPQPELHQNIYFQRNLVLFSYSVQSAENYRTKQMKNIGIGIVIPMETEVVLP